MEGVDIRRFADRKGLIRQSLDRRPQLSRIGGNDDSGAGKARRRCLDSNISWLQEGLAKGHAKPVEGAAFAFEK